MVAKTKKGFSLIELLIVIAIIGVLASLVLVSLTSAKVKAKKSSALASAKSAMEELAVCHEDDGDALLDGSAPVAGTTPICCDSADCASAMSGHTAAWPDISQTGWTYGVPAGDLFDSTYQYALTGPDADTITCVFSTKACN